MMPRAVRIAIALRLTYRRPIDGRLAPELARQRCAKLDAEINAWEAAAHALD